MKHTILFRNKDSPLLEVQTEMDPLALQEDGDGWGSQYFFPKLGLGMPPTFLFVLHA